jgi:hypothetical protein
VAVASSGSSKDTPANTPANTPVNLTGSWSGTLTTSQIGGTSCSTTGVLDAELTHTDTHVTGSATVVSIANTHCGVVNGESGQVVGTADAGRLQLTAFIEGMCQASANYTANNISGGTYACSNGSSGTWSLTRK